MDFKKEQREAIEKVLEVFVKERAYQFSIKLDGSEVELLKHDPQFTYLFEGNRTFTFIEMLNRAISLVNKWARDTVMNFPENLNPEIQD